MQELDKLIGRDFYGVSAKEFEDLVVDIFKKQGYKIKRQVEVPDRGDARKGRIDIVVEKDGNKIALELDWKSPRVKSKFKLNSYSAQERYIILREPFKIIDLHESGLDEIDRQDNYMRNLK